MSNQTAKPIFACKCGEDLCIAPIEFLALDTGEIEIHVICPKCEAHRVAFVDVDEFDQEDEE